MSTSYNNNYGQQAFGGRSATEAAALSWYDMVVRQQRHDRLVGKLFLHEQQQRLQHRILLRADGGDDDSDLNGLTETEQEVPTVDFRRHVWPIVPTRSLDGGYGDDHSRPCSPLDLSVKPSQRAGDVATTTVKATALLQVTGDGRSEFLDSKTSTPVKRRGQSDSPSEARSKSKKPKRTNNNNNNNNNNNEDDGERNDDKLLKKLKAASRKLNFSHKTGALDKSSPVSGTIIVEKPTGPDADYKTERPKNRKRRREDDAADENQPEERQHAGDPEDSGSRDPVGLDAATDDDDDFGGDIDPRFNVVAATPEARQQLAEIPNVIGEYRCRLCTTVYADAFALAAHRCKCIVHVRYRCPECSKVFQCPANLASHRRWHGVATGKNASEANRRRDEQRSDSTPPPSQPSSPLSVDSPLSCADAATTSGTVFFKKNMLQRAAVEANNNNNAFKADNNVVM